MAVVLQHLVDAFNSVGNTSGSLVSSLLSLNYVVGEALCSVGRSLYYSAVSLLLTIFTATRIILEDLVVFLSELYDVASAAVHILAQLASTVLAAVERAVTGGWLGLLAACTALSDGVTAMWVAVHYGLHSLAIFFKLLGSSLVLLVTLVPETLRILFVAARSVILNSGSVTTSVINKTAEALRRAPPELYLGFLVGTTSGLLFLRYSLRAIREHHITWETVATALLRLLCSTYVLFIRSIARTIGFCFRVVETTVSNLRVPMFAHAGDSDDEDEDRENLIGDIQDSDDEDREREARKRRNYDLLLQRRNLREERRGSTDSVEDILLREVEREREDKLCVICVDKEKCIMILPCRHLCICESCQEPLRTHRNLCPICRKQVKQMIKAYL